LNARPENNIGGMPVGEFPLISIGITCYNAADTIERAIRSALSQRWQNFEIVVVDDCSSDESPELIKGLADQYDEIRFIQHTVNRGFPAALNTICSNSFGEFLVFFDDDDESDPDRLKAQYNRILVAEASYPGKPILCYSNRNIIELGDTQTDQVTYAIGREAPEPHGQVVADFLLLLTEPNPYVWGQFGSCTLMTRRQVLLDVEYFDERFRRMAEWDMAIRVCKNDAYFVAVNRPLVTQYKTLGVDGEKSGKTPLKYALLLRKKHSRYLKNKRLYLSSLAMARVRFYYSQGDKFKMRFYIFVALIFSPLQLLIPIIKKSRSAKRIGDK
jgi:glycosyltransferase involved in cell wall biosynthesis